MQYRQLGKSSIQVSRIGFGCMSLKPGQPDLQHLIDLAIGNGINFFDTADLYNKGLNEEMIGATLKQKRKELYIATKVGNQWRPDGSGWDWNPSKAYIIQSVEGSLKRLQTDYIDLYQLHGGTIGDPIDETIEAFETLQKQGKIRYYGISSIRPNVIREYIKRSNIVSVMMQYSLLDRRPEEECLQLLEKNNIGVLARGTIASGLLINKPATDYLDHPAETVSAAARELESISLRERTAVQSAIGFVFSHTSITAAITGIRTTDQLLEIIKTIDSPTLSLKTYQDLIKKIPPNFYKDHR
jgi:aryl-alcohol dehydrogenase-like predicted oxidoreductase